MGVEEKGERRGTRRQGGVEMNTASTSIALLPAISDKPSPIERLPLTLRDGTFEHLYLHHTATIAVNGG